MHRDQLAVFIVLPTVSAIFIASVIISYCNQKRHARKRHVRWSRRYGTRAAQRLENRRRTWGMFGMEYPGTEEDLASSSDEEGGSSHPRRVSIISHARTDSRYTSDRLPTPPPAYTHSAESHSILKETAFYNRTRSYGALDTTRRPQTPEPRESDCEVLQQPATAASSPLPRCGTGRSTRRYSDLSRSAPPVASTNNGSRPPEVLPSTRHSNSEPIPLSPRRLDSVSRRQQNEDGN